MSLYESAAPNPAGHRDLQVDQLPLPPRGFRLVDVREPHEFVGELGHVPGAELMPMGGVLAQATGWNKGEELVLVCRSGGRSAQVASALTRLGFQRCMNLVGGMLAWNAAGKAVER